MLTIMTEVEAQIWLGRSKYLIQFMVGPHQANLASLTFPHQQHDGQINVSIYRMRGWNVRVDWAVGQDCGDVLVGHGDKKQDNNEERASNNIQQNRKTMA
jgi:hypothetical protein